MDSTLMEIGDALGSSVGATAESLEALALLRLPTDYLEFLRSYDGAEGWIGRAYVALWPASDVVANNSTLEAEKYAPGVVLFGSDGGGEAFGFDMTASAPRVVMIPLVGLSRAHIQPVAPSFAMWLAQLRDDGPAVPPDSDMVGRDVYDVSPVILGGSPTDRSNKAVVARADHIQIARWWNTRLHKK